MAAFDTGLLINNLINRLGTTFITNYIDATGGDFNSLFVNQLTANNANFDSINANTLTVDTQIVIGQALSRLECYEGATINNNIYTNNFVPIGDLLVQEDGIVQSVYYTQLPNNEYVIICLVWDNIATKTQVAGRIYNSIGTDSITGTFYTTVASAFTPSYGNVKISNLSFLLDYDSGLNQYRALRFDPTTSEFILDTIAGNPSLAGFEEVVYINEEFLPNRILSNPTLSSLVWYSKDSNIITDTLNVDGPIEGDSLNILGNATFNQNITTSGLTVVNNLSSSNLSVSGNATFNSVSVSGLSVVNNLSVSGLFATSVSGPWVSQDINATSTNTVPSSKTLSDYSVVVNNLIETQLQPLNKATAIQVPTTSDFTIGSGGSFATLQDALASPLVKNGSVLRILENTTLDISTTLTITKQVVIWGENRDTCIIRNATGSPSLTFLLTVQADYVMFNNLTINFTSTISDNFALTFTNSSGGNVVNPIVANSRVIYNKYGVFMRGLNWVVANCLFETQGAATTRRAISIYRSAGNSFVYKNIFNQTIDTSNRLIHVLQTSAADTKLGTINIIGNTSTGVAIQFVNVESFAGTTNGLTYIIKDNIMNESNAFVVFFGGSLVNAYNTVKEVYILNNIFTNRHTTSPFGGKGCLSLDVSVIGRSSSLPVYAYNNVATIDQFYRSGWGLAANATGVQVGITTAGAAAYVSVGYNPVAFVDANVSAFLLPSVPSEFNADENEITIIRSNYVDLGTLAITLGNYALNATLGNYALNATLANYTTNSALSTTLANYPTNSALSTTLGNYALNATLANYITNIALSTTLGNYTTNSALSTTLANYTTNSALSTTLGNYALSTTLSNYALSTTLANYTTNSALSTTLANYTTNSALSTTLGNYALSATLSNYALNTTLGNYATLQFLSATLANYSQGDSGSSTFETFLESQVGSNLMNDTYYRDFKPTGNLTNTYEGVVHSIKAVQHYDLNGDPTGNWGIICLEYNIDKTAIRGAAYESNGNLLQATLYYPINNSSFNYLYGQISNNNAINPSFLLDYQATGGQFPNEIRELIFINEFGNFLWDQPYSGQAIPTELGLISNVYINETYIAKRVLSNIETNFLQFYDKSSSIIVDSITAGTYNNLPPPVIPTLPYLALTGGTLTGFVEGTDFLAYEYAVKNAPGQSSLAGISADFELTAMKVYANGGLDAKIKTVINSVDMSTMDEGGLTLLSNGGNTNLHFESGANQTSRINFGDTNTANKGRIHYHNSTNKMDFHTNNNNVAAMTLDSSGRLGIGTSTPGATLDIAGNGAGIAINGGNGFANIELGGQLGGFLDLKAPNSDDYDMRVISSGSGGSIDVSSGNFNVITNGISKLTVLNNGNVGINTTTPSERFVVSNNSNNYAIGQSYQKLITDSTLASYFAFGTSNLNNPLGGIEARTSSNPSIAIGVCRDSNNRASIHMDYLNNVRFYTNNVERMSINDNGNVGIGSTSPSFKFDVSSGDAGASNNILVSFNTTNLDKSINFIPKVATIGAWTSQSRIDDSVIQAGPLNAGSLVLGAHNKACMRLGSDDTVIFGNTTTETMRIANNGNVGINTNNPSQRLTVNGNIFASGNDSSLFVGGNTTAGNSGIRLVSFDNIGFMDTKGTAINFRVDNTNGASQRMTILSNGNVGINTFTPSQTLNVNGNILATGSITPSDERIKENIVNANTDDNLNHILAIQVKHYDYTDNYVEYCNKDDTPNYGFIAQQVEQVIPNAVKTVPFTISTQLEDGTFETIQHWDDFKIVQKDLIFTEAVGAIQELHKIIQLQKAQIEALELTNLAQEETISNILERLEALEQV